MTGADVSGNDQLNTKHGKLILYNVTLRITLLPGQKEILPSNLFFYCNYQAPRLRLGGLIISITRTPL